MEFKPGEYLMRNGKRAVILSDEYPCVSGSYPLTGVREGNSGWIPSCWCLNGRHTELQGESECDLMPPKKLTCILCNKMDDADEMLFGVDMLYGNRISLSGMTRSTDKHICGDCVRTIGTYYFDLLRSAT